MIRCNGCSGNLTPGSRFCPRCGQPVSTARCAGCDEPLTQGARFCVQCGIATAARSNDDRRCLESDLETTVVAVLIAESILSPSSERKLDAPDLETLQGLFCQYSRHVLDRFGGEITNFIGDRVVSVFRFMGDAEVGSSRILEAGLAMRAETRLLLGHARTLGVEIEDDEVALRVAAHAERSKSLTTDSPDLTEAIDRLGDAACEYLAAADPGEFIASQALLDFAPGLFTYREITGRGATIDGALVQQLSGVRSDQNLPAPWSRTPFVAREVESALLFDRWSRVNPQKGQAVLVLGEAGIGKTRLISSFRERLHTSRYSWIECHCAPELKDSAFQPIVTFIEHIVGLRRNEPQAVQLQQLETALRTSHFPIDETIPLFASLLRIELSDEYPAIPVDREELRRQTLDRLCEWLVRISAQQPTAVFFDDLHWSDPSTLDVISRLIELIERGELPVLLLLAARNEFDPEWPGVERVQLPHFEKREITEMANAVAGDRPLPSVLADEISIRSEGIPLYVEAFTEDILDATANSTTEPTTIEMSMLQRIARVTDPEVARLIAVVGKQCSYELLATIAEGWSEDDLEIEIEKLVSIGVVNRRTEPSGDVFSFRQNLVRTAVYANIAPVTRRAYHERVCAALTGLSENGRDIRPETIARHLKLTKNPKRAISYYQSAAQLAMGVSAHAESILHLREALDLLRAEELVDDASDPEKELELLLTLGPSLIARHGYRDPQVAEVFARAHVLCSDVSNPSLRFRALYGLSIYFQARGSRIRSGEIAEECLVLAYEIGEASLKALSHQRIGLCHFYGGEPEQSLHHLEIAIEFYDPTAHRALAYVFGIDIDVHSRAFAALASLIVGQPDRARQYARSALVDAREGGHQHTLGFALVFSGIVLTVLNETRRVLEFSEEAIRKSERHGFALWSERAHILRGSIRARSEDTRDGAIEEIQQAIKALEQMGGIVGVQCFYEMFASTQLRLGHEQGALDSLTKALDLADESESPFWNAEILRVRGEILARRGQVDEARTALETAVETARAQGARGLELRAASSLERLMRSEGKHVEAKALLGFAWEGFARGWETLTPETASDIVRLMRAGLDHEFDEKKALKALLTRLPRDASFVGLLGRFHEEVPRRRAVPAPEVTPSSTVSDLVATLTPRRLEVLRLIAKGLTNREIARILKISEHTAKAHVAGLLEALNLSNRTEAAVALREYENG